MGPAAGLTRTQAARELGLSLPATPAQVKQAYRRLAREHHPDRGGDPARFQRLTAAVARLEDDTGTPPLPATTPSRTPARAPHSASSADVVDLDPDAQPTMVGARLSAAGVAALLAAPHRATVPPLAAASRAPGSRLNRVAGVLADDLTSRLEVARAADDRGSPVSMITITATGRRARRALERAPVAGAWVRSRGSSRTRLRCTLPAGDDRHAQAALITTRLDQMLTAIDWPLAQWTRTPVATPAPPDPDGPAGS